MKNKRKPLIIALICVAAVALIAAGVWLFWLKDYLAARNAPPVYVNPVSTIVGLNAGSTPRYSGVVEPQQTFKVNKDESKTVSEVLVNVGDQVQPGDVLFRYDTEQLQFDLREAEIAQEGIANQISTLKAQINTLKAEQRKAGKDEQLSYSIEIQSREVQVKQQEYESSLKKSEVDKLKQDLENTDVLCEVEGVVKEVNTTPKTDPSGQQAAFISILSSGEYRVKGTVSELNLSSLAEGQAVIVRSRVDGELKWKGTVETIDREPSQDQNNNGMFYGMETGEKTSKYNFYVVLENLDGLILGQHVYIELDLGEKSEKSGLWLPAVYVDHDEHGSFVWAKDEKDRLEKRTVTLGEYDTENDAYEIKDGVNTSDSIAYPSDTLRPSMPTTTDKSYQDTFTGPGTGEDPLNNGMDNSMDNSMGNGMDSGMDNTLDNGMDAGMDMDIPEMDSGEMDSSALYEDYGGESESGMEGFAR